MTKAEKLKLEQKNKIKKILITAGIVIVVLLTASWVATEFIIMPATGVAHDHNGDGIADH